MEKFEEKDKNEKRLSKEEERLEIEELRKAHMKLLEERHFSKLDIIGGGIEYIPGGNGRRRLVFRTPAMKTIVTMDEPKGKQAIKDLTNRDGENDSEIAIRWVTRVEYDESTHKNSQYPRGKKIVDLNDPDVNAGEQERLIKDLESWGMEELGSLAVAFTYLNKKYLYEDFLI